MRFEDPPYTDAAQSMPAPSWWRQRLLATAIAVGVLLATVAVVATVGRTNSQGAMSARKATAVSTVVTITGTNVSAVRLGAARSIAGTHGDDRTQLRQWRYPDDGSLAEVRGAATTSAISSRRDAVTAQARTGSALLFRGRVRILDATTTATIRVQAGTARSEMGSTVPSRVIVDGRPVAIRPNKVVIVPGIGTVTLDEQAVVANAPRGDAQTGPRSHVIAVLAHVRLDRPYAGLPAGTSIEIGRVDASLRYGKVRRVAHQAVVVSTASSASTFTPSLVPVTAAPAPASGNQTHSIQAGLPKPGTTALPRHDVTVRAGTGAATGNLEGYVFPVLGHSSFGNDWGAARADTGSHQGNDIFAAEGTPIVALADGTLDRVGWNSIGGYRFWLYDRYGNGFYHAHLAAYAPTARDGAVVHAGDVIGFVGHTGDAQGTPPHVHFEVHPGDGAATNPFPYLSAWKQGLPLAITGGLGATGLFPAGSGGMLFLSNVADISPVSGLSGDVLSTVPPTTPRPIAKETEPVPTDKSLGAAIDGGGVSASTPG